MSNSSFDDACQTVANIDVAGDKLEVKDIHRLKKIVDNKLRELVKSKPPSGKPYISLSQGREGVIYLLENDVTTKQVWQWLKLTYNHGEDWISQAKKLTFYHSKRVYIDIKDMDLMKLMRKNKLIRQSTLTETSSYNMLLNKVAVAKHQMVEKIRDKDTIKEQDRKIDKLTQRVDSLEVKVNILEETMEYVVVDECEEAKLLYGQGISQVDLATRYNVTTRTIRNWLKRK